MTKQFSPLNHIPLHSGVPYAGPAESPELVHLTDPAEAVFTDFRVHRPVTVEPGLAISEALEKMKWNGVRLLLVINSDGQVVGLITSRDIEGEKPVRFSQASGTSHDAIRVADIMTPQADIQVLNWSRVQDAEVGHVVATLRAVERYHLLVVDTAEQGDQRIVGLFSATQISNQLGQEVGNVLGPAHSLVEMLAAG